jgi:hypothetical protein
MPEDRDAPLRELVSTAMQGRKDARLMIVCDQFEEFFIAQRTLAGREPFIREVGECVNNGELPVGFCSHSERSSQTTCRILGA